MKLSRLVETSREIAATRSRLRKTDLLATLLRELDESERGVAASYLAGKLPGGRVGVGPSLIRSAGARTPSASSTLTVVDVQASLDALNEAAGEGSSRHRQELLRKLLERATSDEQEFLVRLLMEDLRQGALEGLMVDGIAKAAEIPSVPVRRALMLSGDLRAVTEAALGGGEEGFRSSRRRATAGRFASGRSSSWEIAFNDLQKSPHYRGGLALRFARLKRYRDDKTAEEADTIETVRRLYRAETGMEAPREEPRTMSLFPEEDDGD